MKFMVHIAIAIISQIKFYTVAACHELNNQTFTVSLRYLWKPKEKSSYFMIQGLEWFEFSFDSIWPICSILRY